MYRHNYVTVGLLGVWARGGGIEVGSCRTNQNGAATGLIDSDDAEQRRLDSRLEEQRELAPDKICFVGLDAEQLETFIGPRSSSQKNLEKMFL